MSHSPSRAALQTGLGHGEQGLRIVGYLQGPGATLGTHWNYFSGHISVVDGGPVMLSEVYSYPLKSIEASCSLLGVYRVSWDDKQGQVSISL